MGTNVIKFCNCMFYAMLNLYKNRDKFLYVGCIESGYSMGMHKLLALVGRIVVSGIRNALS